MSMFQTVPGGFTRLKAFPRGHDFRSIVVVHLQIIADTAIASLASASGLIAIAVTSPQARMVSTSVSLICCASL